MEQSRKEELTMHIVKDISSIIHAGFWLFVGYLIWGLK